MATRTQHKQELFKAILATAEDLRNSERIVENENLLRAEIKAIINELEEETA